MDQDGNAGNSAAIALAGRDDGIRAGNDRDTEGDVENRLVVHDNHHTFTRDGTLNAKAHATEDAREREGGVGVQAKPGAHDGLTAAGEELQQGQDDEPLSRRDDDEQVDDEDQ